MDMVKDGVTAALIFKGINKSIMCIFYSSTV